MAEKESMFKSELEKEIWAGIYTRYEPKGIDSKDRMRNAWKLVVDLRKSLEKLLAFGAWARAGAEMLGDTPKTDTFQNDFEKKIWISAFTRPAEEQSAESRAKRAWEFVLDFRKMPKAEDDGWEEALHELAGGSPKSG